MMQNSGDGDVKTNDKFLVQTVAIGDKDSAKLASLAPVKQVEEVSTDTRKTKNRKTRNLLEFCLDPRGEEKGGERFCMFYRRYGQTYR